MGLRVCRFSTFCGPDRQARSTAWTTLARWRRPSRPSTRPFPRSTRTRAPPGRTPLDRCVVMKFGGTSVADPEKLKRVAARLVAAREAGYRVVGVLSAMGKTTDELLALAREVSPAPDPRELDMLVSVGERISCALAAMAIVDLGHEAISLTGSQAGIVTDTVHGKAKIVEVRARRIHEALDDGKIVLVAGLPGRLDRVRGDDARARRLRHDRGRARGRARRRPLRDLHGRARRLLRRSAARPRRAAALARELRRDARDGVVRRAGAARPARSRSLAATT